MKGRITLGILALYAAIVAIGAVLSVLLLRSWIPGVAVGVMIATIVVAVVRLSKKKPDGQTEDQ
jgi:hypothetical protein